MKERLRKALRILLILILVVSAGMLAVYTIQEIQGRKVYKSAQELAQKSETESLSRQEESSAQTEVETRTAVDEANAENLATVRVWREVPVNNDTNMKEIGEINLDALRETNEDVRGWIRIPGTVIDYPVMQGEDNDYYLNHTWEGKSSKVGSIFLETLSSADFTDHHTMVYGHKRGNEGTMFGSLHKYEQKEFYEEHPYVYIKDDAGVHRYEIFSAYEAPVDSKTFQIGFSGDESRQKFLDYCMEMSVIETGVTATLDDRVITLSTCTGNGYEARWVVQARLAGMWVEEVQSSKESEINGLTTN